MASSAVKSTFDADQYKLNLFPDSGLVDNGYREDSIWQKQAIPSQHSQKLSHYYARPLNELTAGTMELSLVTKPKWNGQKLITNSLRNN